MIAFSHLCSLASGFVGSGALSLLCIECIPKKKKKVLSTCDYLAGMALLYPILSEDIAEVIIASPRQSSATYT